MSERQVWVLGQCLWFGTFFVVSLIISLLLKFFLNISVEFTYLEVCIGHFLWRVLKSDLPVDVIPLLFQKQKMNDVTEQLQNLDEELKKLNL